MIWSSKRERGRRLQKKSARVSLSLSLSLRILFSLCLSFLLATMSALFCCASWAGCSALNCCANALNIHQRGERTFKSVYFISYFMTQVLAWQMRDNYPSDASSIEKFIHTEMQGCRGTRCAYEAAVRVALTNVLFFSFMLLVTFKADVPEEDVLDNEDDKEDDEERRATIRQSRRDRFENLSLPYRVHVAYWPFKLLLWLSFLCISFWGVPSENIDVAFEVFRFGAGVFLLVQMIVIIATVYEINEYLVEKAEEGRSGAVALVVGTLLAFALAVATFTVSFTRYDCDGDKTTIAANSIAIVFVVICCGFSLMEDIRGGLFTSAIVALYVAYMMASASMERAKTCNLDNMMVESKDEEIIEIVGFVVQLAVVALSAFKAASGHKRFQGVAHITDDEDEHGSAAYTFFHGVFLVASMHAACLLVGWVKVTQEDSNENSSTTSTISSTTTESFWIKATCAYFTALLYLWSLIAPKVMPDREF